MIEDEDIEIEDTQREDRHDLMMRLLMWREKHINEHNFVLILSFIIGICTAAAALILKFLIHFIQQLLTSHFNADSANYLYLIYPIIGILLAESKGFTVYTCANIQQVVFSILHFLILNGYKFANCRHCGRLYATQNLKNIYCSRTSPYPGYERYYCKDAVKRINDALEKRRDTVYKRLRVRAQEYGYSSKHGTILRNFQDKCCEYKAKIKENASIENLTAYAAYLQSGEGLPKRYERIKRTRP